MKMRRNGLMAAALLLPLVASACDNDLTAINANPNAPTTVPPSFLLTAAIQDAATDFYGTGQVDRDRNELFVQHIARIQYGSQDRYNVGSGDTWDSYYTGHLLDLQLVIERSEEAGNDRLEAMGRILKAWSFQHITDLFGDIPYSEALTGHTPDPITSPVYDSQESIYNSLFEEWALAVARLGTGVGPAIGGADLIYNGDDGKWVKWANSLRLRAALRLSNVNPTKAASEALAAVTAGTFESAADEAKLRYPGGAPNENPMYTADVARPGDYRASRTLTDTLISFADPRLPFITREALQPERAIARCGSVYCGMPNGLLDTHNIGLEEVSRIGSWFLAPDLPAMFQSYAEVQFLKAEAAERGWIPGDAANFYYEGIRSALERFGISETEIDAYIAQPRVQYLGGQAGLRQISFQKWIELYDSGPEAYAEWRRTGVPELTPVPNRERENIPRRYQYPASEDAQNRLNVKAARDRVGGDAYSPDVPVWWDTYVP